MTGKTCMVCIANQQIIILIGIKNFRQDYSGLRQSRANLIKIKDLDVRNGFAAELASSLA